MSARLAVALIGAAFLVTGLVAWLAGWYVGADSAAYRAGATGWSAARPCTRRRRCPHRQLG